MAGSLVVKSGNITVVDDGGFQMFWYDWREPRLRLLPSRHGYLSAFDKLTSILLPPTTMTSSPYTLMMLSRLSQVHNDLGTFLFPFSFQINLITQAHGC